MKILLTGCAGFIGMHTSLKLLNIGHEVFGIDNLNEYYDVRLKLDRLSILKKKKNFRFEQIDLISDKLEEIFKNFKPDKVINLAAQAGVRYSITNPNAYIESNMQGFLNILECCKKFKSKHLTYASSSSVYGTNSSYPFKESSITDQQLSLYAVSKKSNELMAHVYSHNFNLPTTGLRFFTVYGPWGRPDMAGLIFVESIINNKPIKIFNNGEMYRDFTYIDDIVEGIVRVNDKIPYKNDKFNHKQPIPNACSCPYKIFNIGNSNPVHLLNFISIIEKKLNKKAKKIYEEMQIGDVNKTYSDTSELKKWINYNPNTDVEIGISKLIDWYLDYYK